MIPSDVFLHLFNMENSFFIIIYFSSFILTALYFSLNFLHPIEAALFEIENNCTYTVWAAAVPGGGRELRQGQTWFVNTDPNFGDIGRIWARTNCNFSDGIGKCETGDCDGALYCESHWKPPVTLAEYSFRSDQTNFFDISLVDGFNVPMEFRAASTGCSETIKCTADINSLCPTELRDPGGCNNPCSVFQNDQFCCTGARRTPETCVATPYSKFFKGLCPDVYTYAFDDASSVFTCPGGTNYKIVFCPRST